MQKHTFFFSGQASDKADGKHGLQFNQTVTYTIIYVKDMFNDKNKTLHGVTKYFLQI